MQTRKEIVEKLYVLKSILSVISIKQEILKNDYKELDKYQDASNDLKLKIEALEKTNNNLYLSIESNNKSIKEYQKEKEEFEKGLKKEKGISGMFKRLMHGRNGDFRGSYAKEIYNTEQKIKNCEYSISKFNQQLNENNDNLRKLKSDINYYEPSIKKIEDQLEIHKKSILPICHTYYELIVEEFHNKGVLDYRDWPYLDLIIFYLESGRGETIKEALFYVDEEKRINRIVNALNNATLSICQTIHFTIDRLRADMNNGFNMLSNSINSAANNIVGKIISLEKTVSSSTDKVATEMQNITRQIETGNALKQKANINTNILINDLNYMIAEYKKYYL